MQPGMPSFVLRVYGIYIDSNNNLLVSDEIVHGKKVTKFPGGGLEYGESTIDCLRREMLEETGIEFEVTDHFYTTDRFIKSAFHQNHQLISIYYFIKPLNGLTIPISDKPFDFSSDAEGAQSFRLVPVHKLHPSQFNFPVDEIVVERLLEMRQ